MIAGASDTIAARKGGTRLATGACGAPRASRRVGIGGLALVAALGIAGCGSEPAEQRATGTEPPPRQVVLGLRLLQSEAGRVRWVLRADSAQAQGEGERMRLWGVNLEFFGAGGDSVQSTLTSLEGEADPRSRELLARGNVVVATRGDRRLETEELRWDPEREKMISDVPVRLYKGLSVIRGTGIVADPDLGSYEIRAPVEGQVREEDRLLDGL